jgi:hypothetical protein
MVGGGGDVGEMSFKLLLGQFGGRGFGNSQIVAVVGGEADAANGVVTFLGCVRFAVVSECVGGSGRLASFDGLLSGAEMSFEVRPRLGGSKFFVPSADVVGENSSPSYDNQSNVYKLFGRLLRRKLRPYERSR